MTRKVSGGLLICFAALAILPWSQHLPLFGGPASDAPIERGPEQRAAEFLDAKHSGSDKQNVSTSLRDLPAASAPKAPGLETALKLPEAREKKTPEAGITGIVTLESGMGPEEPKAIAVQAPSHLPKLVENQREYAPLVQALQCMLDDRHEEALKYLRAYDDSTQQFFLRLLPPLTILVKKRIEDLTPAEVAVLIDQIDGLRISLLHRSELVVSKLCYCKQEKGYQVKTGKFPFVGNSKATILDAHDGFIKVVTDAKYGEILGVHIIGPY